MIARLRSLLFAAVFYGWTVPMALATAAVALVSRPATIRLSRAWGRWFLWSAEVLLGIRLEVRGTVPQTGAILAMKHSSAFEAFLVLALFDRPATIMKEELLRIPVWGFIARRQGSIGIAREKGGAALRAMIREARAAAAEGRPIIIFPEGTRVPHGTAPPLKPGLAALAAALRLPVVPVAHDAGRLWPKGLVKRPGTVTMAFLPPVPPELPREALEGAVHAAINQDPRSAGLAVSRPAGASRVPLAVALLPLFFFLLMWWRMWDGYRDQLVRELRPLLPPGTALQSGGFPYRLEVRMAPVAAGARTGGLRARLQADSLRLNQVPWKPEAMVLSAARPEAALALEGLAGATLAVRAPAGQASLRRADGRIVRLSTVWDRAEVETDALALPVSAERLEIHLRERPAPAPPGGGGAGALLAPAWAGLAIRGEALRLGGSAPLSVQLEADVRALRPPVSRAGSRAEGTVEVGRLVVADAHGEIARAAARLAPDGRGGLGLAGTIETVCPRSIAAALSGAPPVSELRARKPLVLAFSGRLGGRLSVAGPAPGRPIPVRGQEPPCPRLR